MYPVGYSTTLETIDACTQPLTGGMSLKRLPRTRRTPSVFVIQQADDSTRTPVLSSSSGNVRALPRLTPEWERRIRL